MDHKETQRLILEATLKNMEARNRQRNMEVKNKFIQDSANVFMHCETMRQALDTNDPINMLKRDIFNNKLERR